MEDLNFGERPVFRLGGNIAEMIAGFDWATTKLGPMKSWPPSLRSAVSLVLNAAVPMLLLWGADGYVIYNEACSVFASERHPELIGRKVRDGWPEIASFSDHVLKTVLGGQTAAYHDQEFTILRNGNVEKVWMDLNFSPVLDESGQPAGVIGIIAETTWRVLTARSAAVAGQRLELMFAQGLSFMALLDGPEHRFEVVNESYRRLIGGRDVVGKTVAEALPDAVEQGYLEILDRVFRTGAPYSSSGARYEVQAVPGGPPQERFVNFIYQPLTNSYGTVTGIFVEGVDVTARTAAETRLVEINVTRENRPDERIAEPMAREALISTFFNYSPEFHAVFSRQPSGLFRYEEVNPATLRLYKLSRKEVIGRTIEDIFGLAAAAEINRHFNLCLKTGLPRRYQRSFGASVIEAVATPVIDGQGSGSRILVSGRDVSDGAAREASLVASNKLLEEIATTDALTRVNNRRGFDEALAREWRRATRLHSGIALLLFDVDEFKSFNDNQGHLQGDECLRLIATCLRKNVGRACDVVARYGGEEFAVLLADVGHDADGPMIVAERLRAAVADLCIPHPASRIGIVTVSCGIGMAWPKSPARRAKDITPEKLINEADAALYTAKAGGRNQIYGPSVNLFAENTKRLKN